MFSNQEWSLMLTMSVMKSCSSALCVLVLLITTFTIVNVSSVPQVTVKLRHPATLPCSERCPGVVRWTESHKPTEVLAECDQTSCRSVKEGYQMIHDQYLKGDLSLTITAADFSMRNIYTCRCETMDICDVALKLETLKYSKEMKPGESLILDLPVSESVKVTFDRTGDPNPVKLCEIEGHIVRCESSYKERVLFQSSLQLMELTNSDDGVYTIIDTENKEIVCTYEVSVQTPIGEQNEKWSCTGPCGLFFGGLGLGLLIGLLLGCFIPLPKCCGKRRKGKPTNPESVPLEEVS